MIWLIYIKYSKINILYRNKIFKAQSKRYNKASVYDPLTNNKTYVDISLINI